MKSPNNCPSRNRRTRSLELLRIFSLGCLLGGALVQTTYAAAKLTPAQIAVPSLGQHLVDEQVNKHPEVQRLALHVTPPGRPENTIVASNFGRIGKKADQDDLDVIAAGVTHLDPDLKGGRVSIYPMLLDKAGHKIGSVGVVFAYKAGDDLVALQKVAEKIRDEISAQIPDLASLFDPWP